MSNRNEPAFPMFCGEGKYPQQGMSLRDYFAAKAMQSLIVADGMPYVNKYKEHSKIAYEQADAMMEAREK